MAEKKYVGAEALIRLVAQLKAGFASKVHEHTLADITDYNVDSSLSSTSTNPVQNNVLNAKFEELESSMIKAVEISVDENEDAVIIWDNQIPSVQGVEF